MEQFQVSWASRALLKDMFLPCPGYVRACRLSPWLSFLPSLLSPEHCCVWSKGVGTDGPHSDNTVAFAFLPVEAERLNPCTVGHRSDPDD